MTAIQMLANMAIAIGVLAIIGLTASGETNSDKRFRIQYGISYFDEFKSLYKRSAAPTCNEWLTKWTFNDMVISKVAEAIRLDSCLEWQRIANSATNSESPLPQSIYGTTELTHLPLADQHNFADLYVSLTVNPNYRMEYVPDQVDAYYKFLNYASAQARQLDIFNEVTNSMKQNLKFWMLQCDALAWSKCQALDLLLLKHGDLFPSLKWAHDKMKSVHTYDDSRSYHDNTQQPSNQLGANQHQQRHNYPNHQGLGMPHYDQQHYQNHNQQQQRYVQQPMHHQHDQQHKAGLNHNAPGHNNLIDPAHVNHAHSGLGAAHAIPHPHQIVHDPQRSVHADPRVHHDQINNQHHQYYPAGIMAQPNQQQHAGHVHLGSQPISPAVAPQSVPPSQMNIPLNNGAINNNPTTLQTRRTMMKHILKPIPA